MNFNQKWGAKTLAKINYFRVLKFKEMKEFIPASVFGVFFICTAENK